MIRKYGGRVHSSLRSARPAGLWWALTAGLATVLLLFVGALMPLMGLVMSVSGVGPFQFVPMARIVLVATLGYLLALLFLAAILRTRKISLAWLLACLAGLTATIATVYPPIAAASSIAAQVGGMLPALTELWETGTSALGW